VVLSVPVNSSVTDGTLGATGLVLRRVKTEVPTFEALELPPILGGLGLERLLRRRAARGGRLATLVAGGTRNEPPAEAA
jgi:Tfp pilus assembly ATPase PilU